MRSGEIPVLDGRAELRFDVGTLWTLERYTHVARCALVWVPHAWELCVLIDDQSLLSERCRNEAEVLAVATAWGTRLRGCGWSQPERRAGVEQLAAE
jgi:hypothetical protein